MKHAWSSGVLALALTTSPFVAPANAQTYTFDCITNNSAANCAAGQSQLFMDVSAYGSSQVLFDLRNAGALASSITDIYFDDGTLLGIAAVINYSSGVDFSVGAAPGNLPGGNTLSPPFVTSAPTFSADSNPPTQPKGVNPGEKVGIVFDLLPGKSFTDVVQALQLAGADGGLRVGLHVQGFADGGSESFVNAVPEASTWLMMLLGLGIVGARVRRIGVEAQGA